jgi:hypothetical protein
VLHPSQSRQPRRRLNSPQQSEPKHA